MNVNTTFSCAMFGRSSAAPAFNVQDTPRPPAEAKLEALYREQQHARERPPAPAPPMGVPARQPTSSRHASRQPIDAEDPRSPLQGGPPRDSPWSGFGSLWDMAASALERLSSSSLHVEEPVEEERRAEEEPSASIKTDELGLALAEGAAADVPKLGPTRTARLQVKVDALMAQLNHFVAALNRANVPGGGKSAVPGVGKSAGAGRDSRDSRNRRDCSDSSGSSISGNERQWLAQMLPPLEDAQPRILSILRGGTIADRELIVQLVELYQGIDEARRRYWKLQGWHGPDPSPPAVHTFAEYAPETEAIKAAAAAKAKAAVAKAESAAEIEAELKRFKAELKAQKRAGNRTGDVGMPATSSVASRASRASSISSVSSSLDPGAARISSVSSVSGTGSGAITAPTRSPETTRPPAIRTPEEAEAAAASATGDYLGDYLGDMDDEERRLDEEERRLDDEEEEERAAAKLRAMVAHRSHWTSPFEALRGTQGGRHRHSAHRRSPWRSPSHFGTSPSLKAIARSTSALTMALGGQLQEQLASPSRFLRHQMEMHREAQKEYSRHREVRREHSRQEREHSQKERERSRQREYSTWVLPTHVDHKPWFCMLSTLACTIVFIFEVRGVPRIAYDGLGWPLMAYDGLGWPRMASVIRYARMDGLSRRSCALRRARRGCLRMRTARPVSRTGCLARPFGYSTVWAPRMTKPSLAGAWAEASGGVCSAPLGCTLAFSTCSSTCSGSYPSAWASSAPSGLCRRPCSTSSPASSVPFARQSSCQGSSRWERRVPCLVSSALTGPTSSSTTARAARFGTRAWAAFFLQPSLIW